MVPIARLARSQLQSSLPARKSPSQRTKFGAGNLLIARPYAECVSLWRKGCSLPSPSCALVCAIPLARSQTHRCKQLRRIPLMMVIVIVRAPRHSAGQPSGGRSGRVCSCRRAGRRRVAQPPRELLAAIVCCGPLYWQQLACCATLAAAGPHSPSGRINVDGPPLSPWLNTSAV